MNVRLEYAEWWHPVVTKLDTDAGDIIDDQLMQDYDDALVAWKETRDAIYRSVGKIRFPLWFMSYRIVTMWPCLQAKCGYCYIRYDGSCLACNRPPLESGKLLWLERTGGEELDIVAGLKTDH